MQYVGMILYGFIALFAVLTAFKGLRRKTFPSLIAFLFAALEAVASAVATWWLVPKLLNMPAVRDGITGFINSLGGANGMIAEALEVLQPGIDYFEAALCAGLIPFVFVIVFIVVALVGKIVLKIINLLFFNRFLNKKLKLAGSALGGALISALEGVLIALVILIPIGGFITMAHNTVDFVYEIEDPEIRQNDIVKKVESIDRQYLEPLSQHGAFRLIDRLGGNIAFDMLARAKVGDSQVILSKKTEIAGALAKPVFKLVGKDPLSWGEPEIEALREIKNLTVNSTLLGNIVPGALNHVGNRWANGEAAFGMPKPQNERSEINRLIDDLVDVCVGATKETVSSDLDAVINIFEIIQENNLSEDIKEMSGGETPDLGAIDALRDRELIENIYLELYESRSFGEMLPDVHAVLIHFLLDALGDPADIVVAHVSMTKEDVQAEAGHTAGIIANMADFMAGMGETSGEGMEKAGELDLLPLAHALESFRDSKYFGQHYARLIDAICNGEMSDMNLGSASLSDSLKDPNTNIPDLLLSAQRLIRIANATSSATTDTQGFTDLLMNIDKGTAETLKAMLNDASGENPILGGEGASADIEAVGTVLDVLAVVNGNKAAGEGEAPTDIFGEGEGALDAGDTIAQMADSSVIRDNLSALVNGEGEGEQTVDPLDVKSSMTEEDTEKLSAALTDYYAQQEGEVDPETAEANKKFAEDLNAFFGLGLTFPEP